MTAAFRGNKRRNPMGSYSPNSQEMDAALWCHKNNICICPRQTSYGSATWVIDIEKGVYPNRQLIGTSEPFGPVEIWQKTYEYKLYYYKKYANKV